MCDSFGHRWLVCWLEGRLHRDWFSLASLSCWWLVAHWHVCVNNTVMHLLPCYTSLSLIYRWSASLLSVQLFSSKLKKKFNLIHPPASPNMKSFSVTATRLWLASARCSQWMNSSFALGPYILYTWMQPNWLRLGWPRWQMEARRFPGSEKLLPPADYTYSYAESVDRDYNHNDLVHKRKNREVVHDKTTKTRTSVSREERRNDRWSEENFKICRTKSDRNNSDWKREKTGEEGKAGKGGKRKIERAMELVRQALCGCCSFSLPSI